LVEIPELKIDFQIGSTVQTRYLFFKRNQMDLFVSVYQFHNLPIINMSKLQAGSEEDKSFCCYILVIDTSTEIKSSESNSILKEQTKNLNYIGFSKNWHTRLNQHNSSSGGSIYTRKKRDSRQWKVFAIVQGFRNRMDAVEVTA